MECYLLIRKKGIKEINGVCVYSVCVCEREKDRERKSQEEREVKKERGRECQRARERERESDSVCVYMRDNLLLAWKGTICESSCKFVEKTEKYASYYR